MSRIGSIIVAAGSGARFCGPKQFAVLGGKPLIDWSCGIFQDHPLVDEIVLVLPDEIEKAGWAGRFPKIVEVVSGGRRRQDSVRAGFDRLDPVRTGFVLVHDGARPLVSPRLIDRVIEAGRQSGAVVPIVSTDDTVKEIEGDRVVRTLDRSRIGRVQTPQGFAYALLGRALTAAEDLEFTGTDEASLVERLGLPVTVVAGDPGNIKITIPLDLVTAEAIRHENRPGV